MTFVLRAQSSNSISVNSYRFIFYFYCSFILLNSRQRLCRTNKSFAIQPLVKMIWALLFQPYNIKLLHLGNNCFLYFYFRPTIKVKVIHFWMILIVNSESVKSSFNYDCNHRECASQLKLNMIM